MSEANKTRYEVQKIIADCVKAGLTEFIGASHGYGVMEFAQASFANANKIVLLNPIRVKRVGWQSVKFADIGSVYKRTDEWIEEQHWQIHVLLKKSRNPEVTDMQADDVAGCLIAWLNGKGCEYFRKHKCANLIVASDSILVYNDDSELYQKRAVFTMKLQVPKQFSIGENSLAQVVPGVYPI